MTKVVFISGNKPRSGKGIVAKYLHSVTTDHGCYSEVMEFKDKLFEVTSDFIRSLC